MISRNYESRKKKEMFYSSSLTSYSSGRTWRGAALQVIEEKILNNRTMLISLIEGQCVILNIIVKR